MTPAQARLIDDIGPASVYIPNRADKPLLIEWAQTVGISAAQANVMPFAELVNVYSQGTSYRAATPAPIDVQTMLAEAIQRTVEAMRQPFDLRAVVREEIDATMPRRLEIATPTGCVVLPGLSHYRTPLVLQIAALGHPIMMVGPAGCGKTTIGEQIALALQLPFYITSTINDTHELTGFVDGYGKYQGTPFRRAYEHGGVWVADEIDAWDAAALLTANSALANGICTFPDASDPVRKHNDFRMIATANTFGTGADRVYVGRNELDAASLDRFAVIEVDYDLTLERMFANGNERWLEHVWKTRKAVEAKNVRHVVSSRCISMGSLALSVGVSWSDCEALYLYKGMSSKDKNKL